MFLGPDSTMEDLLVTGMLSGIGVALDTKDIIESFVYSERMQYIIQALLIGTGEGPNNFVGDIQNYWRSNIS